MTTAEALVADGAGADAALANAVLVAGETAGVADDAAEAPVVVGAAGSEGAEVPKHPPGTALRA